jgi:hypothetical protein
MQCASGWRPCSLLRAIVFSAVPSLVRGRFAVGLGVRCLAARFVLAGLAVGLAVRCLAARFVRRSLAVRLALRRPATRLILSRLA